MQDVGDGRDGRQAEEEGGRSTDHHTRALPGGYNRAGGQARRTEAKHYGQGNKSLLSACTWRATTPRMRRHADRFLRRVCGW